MTKIIQIENTNSIDFKLEIISEFKAMLKDVIGNIQTNSEEVYLTRDETSKLLSISLVTLWDWTRKDIIPAYRIGNKVRYKKSEVVTAMQKMNSFKTKNI